MGARLRSGLQSLWKGMKLALMWAGLAQTGSMTPEMYGLLTSGAPPVDEPGLPPDHPGLPPDHPCLPALSEEEFAEWTALIKQLR